MTLAEFQFAASRNCNNRYAPGDPAGFDRFKHDLFAMARWINWQSRDEPSVYADSEILSVIRDRTTSPDTDLKGE